MALSMAIRYSRSEEHTSELQSPCNLVCRLLLEKKKSINNLDSHTNTTLQPRLTSQARMRTLLAAVCSCTCTTRFLSPDVLLNFLFFFFNETATTEIYTLSLHDALPIYLLEEVFGLAKLKVVLVQPLGLGLCQFLPPDPILTLAYDMPLARALLGVASPPHQAALSAVRALGAEAPSGAFQGVSSGAAFVGALARELSIDCFGLRCTQSTSAGELWACNAPLGKDPMSARPPTARPLSSPTSPQIGRASCRERV